MKQFAIIAFGIGLAFAPSTSRADHNPLQPPQHATPTLLAGWGWMLRWAFLPELYHSSGVPPSYVTVTATAEQGGWSFKYRLLDQRAFELPKSSNLIVPVDHTVQLIVTSTPGAEWYIFAIPAFGVKMDAIPGSVASSWFEARSVGVFNGGCDGTCEGYYLPFELEVFPADQFDAWAGEMHSEHGKSDP